MILEKNRERGIDVFPCFIDYAKAFDTVAHDSLWNDMYSMGFPPHVISLLKALYHQQKAAVDERKLSFIGNYLSSETQYSRKNE